MTEPLEMSLQERMEILAFASKAAEMLEDETQDVTNPVNREQLEALADLAKLILGRLDAAWPGMLAVPHDGRTWAQRAGKIE